ncbi:MAG: DUF4446 family protein [Parcubacteria group bacterium]|jgi:hypothetical protein
MNENFQLVEPYLLGGILFLAITLLILNIVLFLKFRKINKLSEIFFSGKNGKDLEEFVINQGKSIQKIEKDIKELFDGYEKIYNIAARGIQKIGVVRYNPFKEMGGNQSFSIAMMDSDNSGLIISTLATREGVRVFCKAIINGECADLPLIDEERRAIKIARASKKSATV